MLKRHLYTIYIYFSFLLFLSNHTLLTAQNPFTIRGVIKDSISDAPLKAVTVKIDGNYQVVLSNSKGVFELTTKQQNPVLKFSYMGYKEKSIQLNLNDKNINAAIVLLSPTAYELEEVTAKYAKHKYSKKNNPAVELIQKVIARKDEIRPENQDFYQCEKYEKIALALDDFNKNIHIKGYEFLHNYTDISPLNGNDVLWLSIKEKISDVYYRKQPKTKREIVKGISRMGVDESFNPEGIDAILSEIFTEINIFDNDINYLMTRFVSPISNFATSFYKYYIVDTVQIDNRQYIDLEFVPFNVQSIGFTGHVFIANDSSYTVKKIQLDVPKDIQLNYVDRLRIEQEFEPQKNGALMLAKETMWLNLYLIKAINGFQAEISRHYSDYSFNQPPKEIFALPVDVSVSPEAGLYSPELWEMHRRKGMSEKQRALANMMTDLSKKSTFNLAGILFDVISTGYIPTGINEKNKIEVGKVNSLVSFNDVEDWRFRLDFRTTTNLHKHLYLAGYGAYGTLDKKFKYFGDLRYSFNERKNYIDEFPMNNIGVSYKYDLEIPGQFSLTSSRDNIFMSIGRAHNDKMSYVKTVNAFYEKEFMNDFSFRVSGEYREDKPTGNLHYYKKAGDEIVEVKDMTTSTVGIKLRYAPGQKFYQNRGRRMRVSLDNPEFILTQKIGLENLFGADYHIHSTELMVQKRFWLSAFGNVVMRMDAGKVWNEAPFPLLFSPNANPSYYLSANSFSMMNLNEFISDQYASWNVTYHANGWILNRIPLIRRLKFREVFSLRGFWGSLSDKNNPALNSNQFLFPTDENGNTTSFVMDRKTPYMEATFGLENILKIFRIEYIRRLSYLGNPDIKKGGWQIGLNIVF